MREIFYHLYIQEQVYLTWRNFSLLVREGINSFECNLCVPVHYNSPQFFRLRLRLTGDIYANYFPQKCSVLSIVISLGY